MYLLYISTVIKYKYIYNKNSKIIYFKNIISIIIYFLFEILYCILYFTAYWLYIND